MLDKLTLPDMSDAYIELLRSRVSLNSIGLDKAIKTLGYKDYFQLSKALNESKNLEPVLFMFDSDKRYIQLFTLDAKRLGYKSLKELHKTLSVLFLSVVFTVDPIVLYY